MTEPTARRDAAEWGDYVTDGHTYEPANLPTYSKPTDRDAAVDADCDLESERARVDREIAEAVK